MSRLADDCCERVLKGETMYIHCWSVMRAEGAGVGSVCAIPGAGILQHVWWHVCV
jgi:hypothetical protein